MQDISDSKLNAMIQKAMHDSARSLAFQFGIDIDDQKECIEKIQEFQHDIKYLRQIRVSIDLLKKRIFTAFLFWLATAIFSIPTITQIVKQIIS